MYRIQTHLHQVPLKELRPTQVTIGMREVGNKRAEWAALPKKHRLREMDQQLFPAVKGPKSKLFILDHHHLALALLKEGVRRVEVGLVSDLSTLSSEDFWIYLDHRSWVHCYDEHGERQTFAKVPAQFDDMVDDPFRSLASSVQKRGGFAKPDEPFLEFLWANYLRRQISHKLLVNSFDKAVARALKLAKQSGASHLPGWSGPR